MLSSQGQSIPDKSMGPQRTESKGSDSIQNQRESKESDSIDFAFDLRTATIANIRRVTSQIPNDGGPRFWQE